MTNGSESTTAPAITEEALEELSLTLYERSLEIQVKDQESYGIAGTIIKEAKLLKTQRVNWFAGMKKAASDALDQIRGKEKEAVKPLDEIITNATRQQNDWLAAEHEKNQAAQRKLEAEERERVRLEKEKLEAQAKKLEEKGKTEKADEKREAAAEVEVAPVFAEQAVAAPVKTTSAAGVAATSFTQMETEITVTNPREFLVALLEGNYQPTMISIGVAPLKAWVKANDITKFAGLHIKQVPKARNR